MHVKQGEAAFSRVRWTLGLIRVDTSQRAREDDSYTESTVTSQAARPARLVCFARVSRTPRVRYAKPPALRRFRPAVRVGRKPGSGACRPGAPTPTACASSGVCYTLDAIVRLHGAQEDELFQVLGEDAEKRQRKARRHRCNTYAACDAACRDCARDHRHSKMRVICSRCEVFPLRSCRPRSGRLRLPQSA